MKNLLFDHQDCVGSNSGSLFDGGTGSQRRRIYVIEILDIDEKLEKLEIGSENTPLLLMDDYVEKVAPEEKAVLG